MASIARLAIEQPLYPWLLIVTMLCGGIWGLSDVGRLEDPRMPFNRALIVTQYDGASAVEVEQEVTEVLEAAIQRLPHFELITSKSINGRSEVFVDVDESIGAEEIPQIWDELRRRVSDAQLQLPPGTSRSLVVDDFGDIFGLMYAVRTPGYSDRDVRDIAKRLETGVKTVQGVAQVSIDGEPQEAIYLEIDHARLTRLGLPVESVFQRIAVENQVNWAGSMLVEGRRLRIAPQLAFDSVEALEELTFGVPGTSEILRLRDIASIRRERVEVPVEIVRYNGEAVFTLGVSVVLGANVVEVGKAIDQELNKHLQRLPVGVSIETIYAQHAEVEKSINQFLTNLALSVTTVVLALCVFMGWRAGMVVGCVLMLSVLGTMMFMPLFDINLQRISLGALMISMGMLVDNGIVVAEGMVVGVRKGLHPTEAAERAVERTKFPLLGATVIGIVAFAPISLSDDSSGHFLRSLFQVIAIALMLSWVLAITLVPMLGSRLLKAGRAEDDAEVYQGMLFAPYRILLGGSLRRPWLATLSLLTLTCVCLWSFQFVKPGFFPTTNAPFFYVDYWLPEGTDIATTERSVKRLEGDIEALAEVEFVASFVGRGANRFTAIMNPQQPNSGYAQIVGRVTDYEKLTETIARLNRELVIRHPEAEIRVFRAEFTVGSGFKVEARVSGPSPEVLRALTDQVLEIYTKHDLINRSNDWRQPVLTLVPKVDEVRARAAGITRQHISQSLAFASEGIPIGLHRDADKLVPIIARAPAAERFNPQGLDQRLVWSPGQQQYIPMSQIVTSIDIEAQNGTIMRRDRVRTMTAMANPPPGRNATYTILALQPEVEAIALPPGYRLEWGGELEGNDEAMEKLGSGIVLAILAMFTLTILLFGRLKQPIIIWLTLPMIVCGVVIGLVATDLPFTFPAFLGFLSLIGMLIKNCIVLVDEIDKRIQEAGAGLDRILEASITRLRPVLLAAGTTIFGMVPLLGDAFFKEMAVCIMSGLAFATILTLVAVPVLYRILISNAVERTEPNVGQTGAVV